MTKQYLSIREASETYGLGRTKIYEELSKGSLTAVKAGTKTLLTVASLDAFMAGLPMATIRPAARRSDS